MVFRLAYEGQGGSYDRGDPEVSVSKGDSHSNSEYALDRQRISSLRTFQKG